MSNQTYLEVHAVVENIDLGYHIHETWHSKEIAVRRCSEMNEEDAKKYPSTGTPRFEVETLCVPDFVL